MQRGKTFLAVFLTLTLLFNTLPVSATPASTAQPNAHLLSHWRFEEQDSSFSLANEIAGAGDWILEESERNSYQTIADKSGLFLSKTPEQYPYLENFSQNIGNEFTVSCVVQADTTIDYTQQDQTILFSKGPRTSIGHFELFIAYGGTLAFYAPEINNNTPVYSYKNIIDGQVHQVSVTYDGTTMTFYVDGEIVNSQQVLGAVSNATTKFTVGYNDDPYTHNLSGLIGDIRIYGEAVAPEQIQAQANELLAHWPLDAEYGGKDLVGGQNLLGVPDIQGITYHSIGEKEGIFLPQSVEILPVAKNCSVNISDHFTLSCYMQADPTVDYTVNHTTALFAKGAKEIGHYELWIAYGGTLAFYAPEINNGMPVYSYLQVADGQPHQVSVSYDGSTMTFYVDDLEPVAYAVTGSVSDRTDDFTIGYITNDPASFSYSGFLSDIRIYGKALAPNEEATAEDALLGHWTLNHAQDLLGMPAQPIQSKRVGGQQGIQLLPSLGDYPQIADFLPDLSQGFTIGTYIQSEPSQSNLQKTLLSKGPATSKAYDLFLYNGVLVFTAPQLNSGQHISSGYNVADGQLHHVGVTFDGATMCFYVDGAQVASVPVMGTLQDTIGPLTLGATANDSYGYDGFIGNLQIYDIPWSEEEMGAFAPEIPDPTLLGHWALCDAPDSATLKNQVEGGQPFLLPDSEDSYFITIEGKEGLMFPANISVFPYLEDCHLNLGNQFTISFSIQTNKNVGSIGLLSKGLKGTGHFEVWLANGTLSFYSPEINEGAAVYSNIPVADGQLHRVSICYDGETMCFYVDDQDPVSFAVTGNLIPTTAKLTLGYVEDTYVYPFSGFLSDIRVYDAPLAPQEEGEIAAREKLIAHWPLTQSYGGTDLVGENTLLGVAQTEKIRIETIEERTGLSFPTSAGKHPSIQSYPANLNGAFTISFFLKADPVTAQSPIAEVILSKGPATNRAYELSLDRGMLSFFAPGFNNGYPLSNRYNVADNELHHVALTFDGERAYYYVDGNAVTGSYIEGAVVDEIGQLTLGAIGNDTYGFSGFLSDVRLYNAALDRETIQELADGLSFTPPEESEKPAFTPEKYQVSQPLRGMDRILYPQALPIIDYGSTVGYEGSISRVGDNDDWDWNLYQDENGEWVLFEADGPGCLYNFTQHRYPTSTIPTFHFYFDGAEEPQFSIRLDEFGEKAPFLTPVAGIYDCRGADSIWVVRSFVPMPFQEHVKITSDIKLEGNLPGKDEGGWGHVTYQLYDTQAGLQTYSGQEDYTQLINMTANVGQDPKYAEENQVVTEEQVTIPAGETLTLLNQAGEGAIASVKLDILDFHYTMLQNLRIRMYWDGHSQPDVDAPIGTFFGNEYGKNTIENKTLLLGVKTVLDESAQFYNYYPMPYWESARIELYNEGEEAITLASYEIQNTPASVCAYPKESTGYFISSQYYPPTNNTANQNSYIGTVYGTGHMVYGVLTGIDLSLEHPTNTYTGCEGDVRVFVDGKQSPVVESDGSESWCSYGWGFVTPPQANPFSMYDGEDGSNANWSETRLTLGDSYSFKNSLSLELEHGPFNDGMGQHSGQFFCYVLDKDYDALVETDSVDVGDEASEKAHNYQVEGNSQIVTLTSKYANGINNNDNSPFYQSGRGAFDGSSSFSVNIDPQNQGVVLHRLSDQKWSRQAANVYVDGVLVSERMWLYTDYNGVDRWLDDEFQIPASYTAGKKNIMLTIQPVDMGGGKTWNEYAYRVYSLLRQKPREIIPVKSVSLAPKTLSLVTGDSGQLEAHILPENADNQTAFWSSSNEEVVQVDEGQVTAISPGAAVITVTTEDGQKADWCLVNVTQKVTPVRDISLDQTTATLQKGSVLFLKETITPKDATNQIVYWTTSDAAIAQVQGGMVVGLAPGEVDITAQTEDGGHLAICHVVVQPPSYGVAGITLDSSKKEVALGETLLLTQTIFPANATNQNISWVSSDEGVASVHRGVVQAKGLGQATITVTTQDGGYTATCQVTVYQPVERLKIAPYSVRAFVGEKLDLTVEITPENASTKNITWISEDPSVATVSQNGHVIAKSIGTSRIYAKAQDGSGVTCYRTVTVYPPLVDQVFATQSVLERNSWENTRVTYNIPYNSIVNIEILNKSGQVVRTLRDGLQAKAANGRYATWNLKDDKGNYVKEGTYIARVQATLPTGELTSVSTTSIEVVQPKNVQIADYTVTQSSQAAYLSYHLNTKAAANFYVYDATGNLIFTKKNVLSQPGMARYVWDYRDTAGNRVPKGVYRVNMYAWNSLGKSQNAYGFCVR